MTAAIVASLVALLLLQIHPWSSGVAATRLRVLVGSPAGLSWVDVDSGARTVVTDASTAEGLTTTEAGRATVVGSGVVVQYPASDSAFADSVVGYIGSERPDPIGEADLIAPASATSVWLVVDADRPTAGGVALASAYGTWRSRVFTVPPRLHVVGAVDDGLIAMRGPYRGRRLVVWDPQAQQQIRQLGWVIGVHEVSDRFALVSTGCLTSGCTTAVVDVVSGESIDVVIPTGWSEAGSPRLVTDGGVSVVIRDASGETALAVGKPDDLTIVDGLTPTAGLQALTGPDGWLLVPTADGDVTAWRADMGDSSAPRVELAADEQLIGVSQ